MGYFMWRVLTCRHQEIEYLMQIPGHARCLVNGGFAHLKQRYRPTATHLISYSRSLTYPPALTKLCVIQHGRGVTGNPSCPPNSDQCVACGKLLHSRFVRFMFKNVCGVVMYGEVLQQIKLKCVMTFPISLMTFVTCIMTLTSWLMKIITCMIVNCITLDNNCNVHAGHY